MATRGHMATCAALRVARHACVMTSREMAGRSFSRLSKASFSWASAFCTCLSWCTPSIRASTGATTSGTHDASPPCGAPPPPPGAPLSHDGRVPLEP
eukprot:3520994-Prymnesium_polylepis.1